MGVRVSQSRHGSLSTCKDEQIRHLGEAADLGETGKREAKVRGTER